MSESLCCCFRDLSRKPCRNFSASGRYCPVLGEESGFNGILLGTLFGAVIPGGPYVLFPVLAALYSSGAGIPPMVAMIFAWSCIALVRIPTELGYLSAVDGQKIIWLRILLGIPVPIVAGILAGVAVSIILKM